MVYQGKPSRGCGVCRKRRIKCDEAVPSCSYCVKRQITCPGYKSQFDVAWRDQNSTAEKSVQRRKNAGVKTDHERQVVLKTSSPALSVAIPQDYVGYAADFFFSSYILLPQDGQVQRGFFDSLFPVWDQAPLDSPLRPAVTAVASCLLMAWSHFRANDAVLASQPHYLKGVAAIRKSLQSDKMRDDILMATMMLDMYENVQAFISCKPNKSPHISGLTGLLEYRSRAPPPGKSSQGVLLGARSHLIGKALNSSVPVSSSISKLNNEVGDIPKTTGLMLEDLLAEIATIQALVAAFDSSLDARNIGVANVLETAWELDKRMLAWEASVPADWEVIAVSDEECIPETVRQAGLYQKYCYVYQNLFIANTFNTYHVARIRLQQSILTCLKYLNTATANTDAAIAAEIIQYSIDSICASVPFHLGDRRGIARIDDKTVQYPHIPGQPLQQGHHLAAAAFGGFLLALRLGDLMSLPVYMRPGQRPWIGGQLGRIMGIYSNQT